MHSLTMLHKRKPRTSVGAPIVDPTLTCVLGLTCMSNRSLALNSENGDVIYTAGCTIVLYNSTKRKQEFIINTSRKPITSIAVSLDGKNIASGESGHNPKVRVWDIVDKSQVCEFAGHRFSIDAVCFSPNLRFVVSVGSMHDMTVNVWNWRTKQRIATNNICCKILGLAFSEDGNYFVTVGNRHVKFWYLGSTSATETAPLKGRSGILAEKKNNLFCDVACGRGDTSGKVYVITNTGLLCEFNEQRLLQKWLDLKTERSSCLTVGESYVIVGCSSGIVRVFNPELRFLMNFPLPHFLGFDPTNFNRRNHGPFKYPDAVAVCIDEDNKIVHCVYNDHSFVTWNISDINAVRKTESCLFHGSGVWAIGLLPSTYTDKFGCNDALVTCSSDGSVRLWNPLKLMDSSNYSLNTQSLLRILLLDDDLASLCDTDCFIEASSSSASDKITDNSLMFAQKLGGRCLSIDSCGRFLAVGDKSGNLHVYEFPSLDKVTLLEAHESDVLSVGFTSAPLNLLISSGRDRLIHIFDVANNFQLLRSIDDHSAAISSVCMSNSLLFSCGADKTIIIRNCTMDPNGNFQVNRVNQIVERQSFCNMVVETRSDRIICACQDRLIRFYSASDGKRVRFLRASLCDEGSLMKVDIDSTGSFIAVSCTNKIVYIWDLETSECAGTLIGHSEVVTDLKFSIDGRWIYTVGADSCIFIWKLAPALVNTIRRRMKAKMSSDNRIMKNSVPDIVNSTQIEQTTKDPSYTPKLRRCTWTREQTFNPVKVEQTNGQNNPSAETVKDEDPTVTPIVPSGPDSIENEFEVNVVSKKNNLLLSNDFPSTEIETLSPRSDKSSFSITTHVDLTKISSYKDEEKHSRRTSFTSRYFEATGASIPCPASLNNTKSDTQYALCHSLSASDSSIGQDNQYPNSSLPSYAAHTSSSLKKVKRTEPSTPALDQIPAGPPSWLQKWNSDESLLLGWSPEGNKSNGEEKTFICRCDFTLTPSSSQPINSAAPAKRCRTDSSSPQKYAALESPDVPVVNECKEIMLFSPANTEEINMCVQNFKRAVEAMNDLYCSLNGTNKDLPPDICQNIEETFAWAHSLIASSLKSYDDDDIFLRLKHCLENLKKKPELYATATSMLDSIMNPLMTLLST